MKKKIAPLFLPGCTAMAFKWVFFAVEGLINDDRPGFSLIDPLSSSILSSISWNLKFRQCLGILKPDMVFSFSETLAKISFHL